MRTLSTSARVVFVSSLLTACGAAPEEFGDESGVDDGTAIVAETAPSALTLAQRITGCQNDARVRTGIVSLDICVGADLFFRETFDGNGRSCATCHRVENNYTIDAAFMGTLPSNDPLFVAEFNTTLANLERPAQMRARGLILENADGFAPDPNVRFVLRSTPHNLSMGTSVARNATADPISPPQDRTGWSGDGAPNNGQLRDFQTGAIIQHYPKRLNRVAGTDFRLAVSGELDRIDTFMRQLARTNEMDINAVTMTDSGAEAGRGVFIGAGRCNGCHSNAGANAGFGGGGNRNFNTGVEASRSTALASFPRDGGFRSTPANADGSFGDRTFNTPPLIESADTGPFFHTETRVSGASAHNTEAANTIEQAIAFYDSPAFNASPAAAAGQINLDATQINNIGRFLRGVNAIFNVQMAIKRIEGARSLDGSIVGSQNVNMVRQLLRLSREEIEDALNVLAGAQGGTLNGSQRGQILLARTLVSSAIAAPVAILRQQAAGEALDQLNNARRGISQNINFTMGQGTLMF